MSDRETLLNRVKMYDFAITDATLFLDTHPNCQEALAYYKKYRKLYRQAMMEYMEKYGPLNNRSVADDARSWTWVETKWPWDNSEGEV